MKTLWKSIGKPALVLAVTYPWLACAQALRSSTPTGVATATPPPPSAAATQIVPVSPPTTTATTPSTIASSLSPWAAEIAKLARAGIHDEVIMTYVDGTEGTFNLTADQIIYLKNLGVSNEAIAEMMRHDGEVNAGIRTVAASTVPASQPALHIILTSTDKSGQAERKPAKEPADSTGTSASAVESAAEAQPADFDAADMNPDNLADWASAFGYGEEAPETVQATPIGLSRTYPVRQPYAEEVMGPILVFKASGRTPNVIVIDFSP